MKIVSKCLLCLVPICALVLMGCGGGSGKPDLPAPKGFAPKMQDASSFLPPGVGSGETSPGAKPSDAAPGASAAPGTATPGTATPGTAAPGTAAPGTK